MRRSHGRSGALLRAAVALLGLTAPLLLFVPAVRADIYASHGPDGTISFTDAPLTDDYQLLIREPRPRPVEQPGPSWRETARREAEKKRLDPLLVKAVIQVESGENPLTVSRKGAQGLMQLMPETARTLGVKDPFDPDENIRGGVRYLADMLDRFGGRLDLALAAYNAGPTAVERHGGIPPYRETRNYVRKVLESYRRLSAANASNALDTPLVAMDNRAPVAERE